MTPLISLTVVRSLCRRLINKPSPLNSYRNRDYKEKTLSRWFAYAASMVFSVKRDFGNPNPPKLGPYDYRVLILGVGVTKILFIIILVLPF